MKNYLLFSALFFGNIFASDSSEIKITEESKILIYSNYFWAPCSEAKELLKSRGLSYQEKMITLSRSNYNEMLKFTNNKTGVPQIIIDGQYFGGLLELKKYFSEK